MFLPNNSRISRLSIDSIARHNRARVVEGESKRMHVANSLKQENPFKPRLSVAELIDRISTLGAEK